MSEIDISPEKLARDIVVNVISNGVSHLTGKSLSETYLGKQLKKVGIIDRQFEDELPSIIEATLKRFFENYAYLQNLDIAKYVISPAIRLCIRVFVLDGTIPTNPEVRKQLQSIQDNDLDYQYILRRRLARPELLDLTKITTDFFPYFEAELRKGLNRGDVVILLRIEHGFVALEIEIAEVKADVAEIKADVKELLKLASNSDISIPFLAPPMPPQSLIGRNQLLENISVQLRTTNGSNSIGLYGKPGAGKSLIALSVAHDRQILSNFKDGVLWVPLGANPNKFAELGRWAFALKLMPSEIAKLPDISERARLIQSFIGLRKMLIIIDDAWKVEDALAFKIGGPNCHYILTTRFSEIALEFAGNKTTEVQELNTPDSILLLKQFVPKGLDEQIATELVNLGGGLPLALTLMGKYLRKEGFANQPRRFRDATISLKNVKNRLTLEQPKMILEATGGDFNQTTISLQAAISLSYQRLTRAQKRVLQALSVFPAKPNSFSERAALFVGRTRTRTLDRLIDTGLLEIAGTNRYTIHQTISDYTSLKMADSSTYLRLARYFLRLVENHQKDFALLDSEQANLLAAMEIATKFDFDEELIKIANGLYEYFDNRGLYDTALSHLSHAKDMSTLGENDEALARSLLNLGKTLHSQAKYSEANEKLNRCKDVAERFGYTVITIEALQNLGIVAKSSATYDIAKKYYDEGLQLARKSGNETQICKLLLNLGTLASENSKYELATMHYTESLELARKLGNRELVGSNLSGLGAVSDFTENFADAQQYYKDSLVILRAVGNNERLIYNLSNLGGLLTYLGELSEAEEYFHEGLDLARQSGHREGIVLLLTGLSELMIVLEDITQAEQYLLEALQIARAIDHPKRIIHALTSLGHLASVRGEHVQADVYWNEGRELAQTTGLVWLECQLLDRQGDGHMTAKNWEMALQTYTSLRKLAETIPHNGFIGRALYGLARLAEANGDIDAAKQLGEESLEKFGEDPKTQEIQMWIDSLQSS